MSTSSGPSLLPLTSSSSHLPGGSSSRTSGGGGGTFASIRLGAGGALSFAPLRRLLKVGRMDFELAGHNLLWLCVSPRRVYRNVYYHKQTKNQWARDDPAMVVLISALVAVASLFWSLLYSLTPLQSFWTMLLMVFRDFLLFSALVATALWFLTNTLLLSPPTHSSSTDARVEWAFAFDVAVNGFFTFFLWVYVLQGLLSGLIVKENWVCLWLGNSLWLAALSQYIYITYLGFAALPFIVRSELLLAPLLPVFVGYVLSLLGFNVGKSVLGSYFGTA